MISVGMSHLGMSVSLASGKEFVMVSVTSHPFSYK